MLFANSSQEEKVKDHLKAKANRYFAFGVPSDITAEDMLHVLVPANKHELCRTAAAEFSVARGGDIYRQIDKVKFIMEIDSDCGWAIPRSVLTRGVLVAGPEHRAWKRIEDWLRWRVQESYEWDKIAFCLYHMMLMNCRHTACFYAPWLQDLVLGAPDLPVAVRKRWENVKPDIREGLSPYIKNLARDAGVMFTKLQLLPREVPAVSKYPVRLKMEQYPPYMLTIGHREDDGSPITTHMPKWSENRIW